METWGELFWDAWIRLRLACRRMVKTYWPPRFATWQVCTVTGIVSILLTFVVLNLNTDASLKAENQPAVAESSNIRKPRKPTAATSQAEPLLAQTDPFISSNQEPDLFVTDSADTDFGPSPQAERLLDRLPVQPDEPEPVIDGFQAADDSPQEFVTDPADLVAPVEPLPARSRLDRLDSPDSLDRQPVAADEPVPDSKPTLESVPAVSESNIDASFLAGESQEPVGVTEPAPAEFPAGDGVAAPPASLELPERDENHYSRFGEQDDWEDEQHPPSLHRPRQLGELAPPVQHTPLVSPIRSNSHYSRFGQQEDAEEKRHSVRDIRPTRVDDVAIPGAQDLDLARLGAASQATTDAGDVPAETPAQPSVDLPPVPTETDPEPAVEDPAASAFDLTPVVTTPRTSAPPVQEEMPDEFGEMEEPAVVAAPEIEPDSPEDSEPVPGLFAPEPDEETVPSIARDGGPARSTAPVDHEADADEDSFSRNIRRSPHRALPPVSVQPPVEDTSTIPEDVTIPLADEPVPRTGVIVRVPAERGDQHRDDEDEDVFSRGIRRSPMRLPPAEMSTPPETPSEPESPPAVEQPSFDEPAQDVGQEIPPVDPVAEEQPFVDPPLSPEMADEPVVPATPSVDEPSWSSDETPAQDVPVEEMPVDAVPADDTPIVDAPVDDEPAVEPMIEQPERPEPRVITPTEALPGEKSEPHEADEDEDRIVPMAEPEPTQPRGPGRITVPDMLPTDPPAHQDDSEFRAARPTQPTPTPRIVMEITGPKQAPLGTQVVLHFKLQNLGDAPATGIVVSDVLPPGLQHRLSSDLEYSVARLQPGEIRETNLTVQCVALGAVTNKASLKADGDITAQAEIQFEVVKSVNRRGSAPPPPESPLTMQHHGPERWLLDSTGQFLITVTNTGNQPLRNVSITQTYPQGTRLVHATVGHKVDERNRTVTWTISEFGPGVSYILETELHSLTSGPTTSVARIKVGDADVAEERWTAISFNSLASRPLP